MLKREVQELDCKSHPNASQIDEALGSGQCQRERETVTDTDTTAQQDLQLPGSMDESYSAWVVLACLPGTACRNPSHGLHCLQPLDCPNKERG
mmetsp:Transcript_29132/g.61954  ORF Transcript_29132/g.61954 Transcript_29132/m.61954 type:complete len:93 (+) Transcript_29132:150-428(+)